MNLRILSASCTVFFLLACSGIAFLENKEQVHDALTDWEKAIAEMPSEFSPNGMRILGEGLRKIGRKKSTFPEWRRDIYSSAQKKALSMPGHAEFFRSHIESERAKVSPIPMEEVYDASREKYDFERRLAFETLGHLPSAETIKVLGDYLDDDRDAIKQAKWTSHGMLYGLNPNSLYAVNLLGEIGLRNPVVEPEFGKWPSRTDYDSGEAHKLATFGYLVSKRNGRLKPWREWYQKVKSGELSFSFVGQPVEYRFRADGSWDTISIANPPNDGTTSVSESKFQSSTTNNEDLDGSPLKAPRRARWWWYGIGICALIALSGVLLRRLRSADHDLQ